MQVHCFEFSSAPREDHFLDFEILCEPHANFIPILEADTLIDLGENKYLTALKKGHTPAAWKQKIFFLLIEKSSRRSKINDQQHQQKITMFSLNLRFNSTFNIKGEIAKTTVSPSLGTSTQHL